MKYPTAEIELFSKRHVQLQNGHMLWSSLFFPIPWKYNNGFNEYIFEPLKVNLRNENGYRIGLWKYFYYKNGRLHCEENVVDGKHDGLSKNWYENGQLRWKGYYVNENRNGIWKEWYTNGQLKSNGTYVNGRQNGLWYLWYRNGQLASEVNYVNDFPKGLCKKWYRNGQLFGGERKQGRENCTIC